MNSIDLLHAWTKHASIDTNNLEENGRVCAFLFNDNLPVSVEAPAYSDDVFIVIELTEIGTGEVKRKRLETAMHLNAYALETRGGVIGWDTIGERIILSYRASAVNTQPEMLDNMISNLVEVAENIKPSLIMDHEMKQVTVIDHHFDNMFQPTQP